MKTILIDGSNVIRTNTGADAREKPYLTHGLLGIIKILSRQKGHIQVYFDRGLLWRNRKQENPLPTMRELCEHYNDKRSLYLFNQLCQHPAVIVANDGRPADEVILDREQKLLRGGDDAMILTNDLFLKYTFQYEFLELPLLYKIGRDMLAPFRLTGWTFECPSLGITSPTRFWRR